MKRLCGTPGCFFLDFHDGPCSFEKVIGSRITHKRPAESSDVVESNKFQHSYGFASFCIQEDQKGLSISVPRTLCQKVGISYPDDGRLFIGEQTDEHSIQMIYFDNHCVKSVSLPIKDVLRHDVQLKWREPSEASLNRHRQTLSSKADSNSARRMKCFVKILKDSCATMTRDYVLGLDGKGSNRDVYDSEFAGSAQMKPRFLTYEIDEVPALSQQLLYGRTNVVWTGAMVEEKFGYGSHGSANSPPGIEYLIKNRQSTDGTTNTLLTQDICDQTVGLFLDYCGGIIGGKDFDKSRRELREILSRLPRLVSLCITMSKRQRPSLQTSFENYAETPHAFEIVHSFGNGTDDNNRVVCRIFKRIWQIPRTVRIPGNWFHWTGTKIQSSAQRTKLYIGVIEHLHGEESLIYFLDDHQHRQFDSCKTHLLLNDEQYRFMDRNGITDSSYNMTRRIAFVAEQISYWQTELHMLTSLSGSPIDGRSKQYSKPVLPSKRQYLCGICKQPKRGHKCKG